MKQKLVITLTTVYGSYQYTLSQVAKYIFALFLLLSALSFFFSNGLLMITSSNLDELASDHQQLMDEYQEISEAQETFEQQKVVLDKALDALGVVEADRHSLASLNSSVELQQMKAQAEKEALDRAMGSLAEERDSLAQQNLSLTEQNRRIENVTQRLVELESIMGLSAEGKDIAARLERLQQVTTERRYLVSQIPSGMPLKGKVTITAGYGKRFHPVLKKKHLHAGVDFRAKQGTPIYATADAVVEYGGFHKKSGFGNLIILQHNFGFKTYFAHLKKVVVKNRTFVQKGQLIGYTGNTGISTGPHLHYEVRHMFKKLDPKPFLAMNISNVNETFDAVKSVEWASLRKLYQSSLNAQP